MNSPQTNRTRWPVLVGAVLLVALLALAAAVLLQRPTIPARRTGEPVARPTATRPVRTHRKPSPPTGANLTPNVKRLPGHRRNQPIYPQAGPPTMRGRNH